MMNIREYCQKAKEVDNIDIPEFVNRYLPPSYIQPAELFPDYPDVPYTTLHPDATPEEIYLNRVHTWLTTPLKLTSERVINISAMVHLQSPPFAGIA